MAYKVCAFELVTLPGAVGLERFMKMPMGVGILITDGVVTLTRGARPEQIEAADQYLQGGVTHEVDEATYNLVHALHEEWAWEE